MAETKVSFQLASSLASKHLTDAEYIKGGYFVVETVNDLDDMSVFMVTETETEAGTTTTTTDGTIVNGSLCYVTGTTTDPVNKFYQYNGSDWVQTVYTKAEIDTKLAELPVSGHTHTKDEITDFTHDHDGSYYTKAEIDTALEDTIDSLELIDTNVKLSDNLYTNYNIGKITGATESSSVLLGQEGWTIRQMFEHIFTAQAQTVTTTPPSLSLILTNNSSSIEYGQAVTFYATITASRGRFNSSYYSGGYTANTGVTWSTLNLESTNSTFSPVTTGITSGTQFSFTPTSTYYAVSYSGDDGKIKGKATAPNGYTSDGTTAKNNLGQDTAVSIASNTAQQYSDEDTTTVTAGYVPYAYTLSTSLPESLPAKVTTPTTQNRLSDKPSSITFSGGTDSTYLYIFVPYGQTITEVSAGPLMVPIETAASSKSYVVNNDKSTNFTVYKTVGTAKADTFTIK